MAQEEQCGRTEGLWETHGWFSSAPSPAPGFSLLRQEAEKARSARRYFIGLNLLWLRKFYGLQQVAKGSGSQTLDWFP